MSLFFVTNDVDRINYIKRKVTSITNKQAHVADLVGGYKIVFSEKQANAFSRTTTNGNALFGFGTCFNKKGFHHHAVSDVNSLADLAECQKQGLYGHYVFVIVENGRFHVITDKIGLINIFYSRSGKYHYVSPDLALVSICSGNYRLSEYGVKQFLMKESCVGRLTLFDDIERLMFGCALRIDHNAFEEIAFHEYDSVVLDFHDYADRIRSYFELLNGYAGKITTDLSAGFDTRLIASVAAGAVEDITANTNPNQFDGGVDEAITPVVAELLNIKLEIIDNSDGCNDYPRMMHLVSIGRDIFRSRYWPERLERKYKLFDLSLGGYGGETIRAKYNRLGIESFHANDEGRVMFEDGDYGDVIKDQLSLYPRFNTQDQYTNYLYTVDRMRIWGGAQVYLNSHYGETLHPFMDWYLIGPVLSCDTKDLYNANLQERLIRYFAPGLSEIPVNSLQKRKMTAGNVKVLARKLTPAFVASVVRSLRSMFDNRSREKVDEFFRNYPKDRFEVCHYQDIGVDVDRLAKCGFTYVSRLATINEAIIYIREENSLL